MLSVPSVASDLRRRGTLWFGTVYPGVPAQSLFCLGTQYVCMLKGNFKQFLADHPRVVGALFTLMVLLSQVAPVLANGEGHSGP